MLVYLFKVTLFDNAAPISIFQDEGDAGIDITVENKTVFLHLHSVNLHSWIASVAN